MTQTERNQKILASIRTQTEQGLATKKAARAMLINEGIYTVKGKLRAEFRNNSRAGKTAA